VIVVFESEITGQLRLPFELGYAMDRYPVQGHTYALSARIERDGSLECIEYTVHRIELTNQDQSGLKL
ncbi:YbaY family lipoprotein, partial [Pseudomonas syringae group genomosp. 7]|uniref:YbaY family lipoprotein n=1 Tax=Pseudomonas syringae group genomosp. 7 TaxID=251699 RepID=UPI00376F67A3